MIDDDGGVDARVPDETPYNPLDVERLGESVTDALLGRDAVPLAGLPPFNGAGVYAIYYTGAAVPFAPYEPLAWQNREDPYARPIYVGKAVPSGARKGLRSASAVGPKLHGRLAEHAESVAQATNLAPADFHCRYLVVEDIWIPLGESLLIERFQPLWNVVIDGFGNHDPGRGRAPCGTPSTPAGRGQRSWPITAARLARSWGSSGPRLMGAPSSNYPWMRAKRRPTRTNYD